MTLIFSYSSLPKAFALLLLLPCHELLPSLPFELPQRCLEHLPMLLRSLCGDALLALLAVPRNDLAHRIGDSRQQLALTEGKN